MGRYGLAVGWAIGAMTLAAVTLGLSAGKATSSEEVAFQVAQTHYGLSLAGAFLVFAVVYGVLDVWPVVRPRPILAAAHLGLMSVGSSLILALRFLAEEAALSVNSSRLTLFNGLTHTAAAGYVLTLASLATFCTMLADGAIARRRRAAS